MIDDIAGIASAVRLNVDGETPNVFVHFVPVSEFRNVIPELRPGTNKGAFWVNWTGDQVIRSARVVIDSEEIGPLERSHIIREEITQILGLMRDSGRFPESIFYSGVSTVTEYAEIDQSLIEMLYRPEIAAGMDEAVVRGVLNGL